MKQLSRAVRTFADAMANDFDRDALLVELVQQTVAVASADGAGIMLPDNDGNLRFATASHPRIGTVEQEQALLRQGACHEAYATGRILAIGDLTEETRWPEYRSLCTQEGLRSVLGVPLVAAGDLLVGVINVYREQPSQWSDEDIDVTVTMGTIGAAYVLNASRQVAANDLNEQLQYALDARVVIEQAKGYVMAASGLDEVGALDRLRTEARNSGRKLRDVAQDVLDRAKARR